MNSWGFLFPPSSQVDVNAVRAEWVVVPVDTPSEGPLDPTQPPPPPRTVHQQVHEMSGNWINQ